MTTPKVPKTPKVIEKSITLEQLVAQLITQVTELRIEIEALKAVKSPPKPRSRPSLQPAPTCPTTPPHC